MITIYDVRSIKSQLPPNFVTTLGEVCDFAISQHEEIERLRADIENARRAIGQLYNERDEAYERAAQACEGEVVEYEITRHPEDQSYNIATAHCAQAIRQLKAGEPK